MTEYTAGTPSWVELSTPDAEGALKFYGKLFGWKATDASEEHGGYRTWLHEERSVGGLNPMGEQAAWVTYVATGDAHATADRVRVAGGTVIAGPIEVGELGRMVLFTDREGAFLGAWQAGTMRGADKVNAPGSFAWNDLNTHDAEGAKTFYSAVFGWEPTDHDMGGSSYTVWEVGGRGIGGAAQVPEHAPVRWVVWFAVSDRDDAVTQAGELGANVLEPKLDVPGVGLLAVMEDPQGAFFGVMQAETADE
jgi:predicted enzyme related to lactoylglutathione lyase